MHIQALLYCKTEKINPKSITLIVIIVAMIYGDPCLKHFSVLKVTATKLALRRKKHFQLSCIYV